MDFSTVRGRGDRPDQGFTLIEVIVALALLGIVSTAALYFFVNGTRAATHQQRAQGAVVVANQAMELVNAVSPVPDSTTHVSGSVRGRTQTAVAAAWTRAGTLGTEGLLQTYPLWDPTGASVPALEIAPTMRVSGMTYTATTLIGACYRPVTTNGTAVSCGTIVGNVAEPTTAPAGYTRMLRVIVLVSWKPTLGECTAGTCTYQLSALIDPGLDLTWNTTTQPVATDDVATVDVGGAIIIPVLANDRIGAVILDPVQGVTMLSGTGSASRIGDGTVRFTAPAAASGVMAFTYTIRDAQGRVSNLGTVRVTVVPRAVADVATTSQGVVVTIPVTSNDLGSPVSVSIATAPTTGAATVNGTNVSFDPQGQAGTSTFGYTFTDGVGQVTNVATVTVTVNAYAVIPAADLTVQIPATASGSTLAIDMLGLTHAPAGYLIHVMSTSISQGRLVVGTNEYSASNSTSAQIAYTQQGNVLGVHTFGYQVWAPGQTAASGATKTTTLIIVPTPVDDPSLTAKSGVANQALQVGSNDSPNNYGGTIFLPTGSAPTCGTLSAGQPDAQSGILRFDAPNGKRSCTFTYVAQGTGAYSAIRSAPATVTIAVSP